jgi:hypothetical protein
MARILALGFLATGCIGTRDVEPDWLEDLWQHQTTEVKVAACGGSDTGESDGFSIAGSVLDMYAGTTPADPDSLCAYGLDPTEVLTGGEPTVMSASQVCPDGDYVVAGLFDPPSIGMFISIDDCEGNADTVMKSATGVDFDDISDFGDGDVLEDFTAYLITRSYGLQIDEDLVDFEGDALTTGFMSGFLRDAAENPVDDAQMACSGCADFYYLDTDPEDGLFSTAGARNESASADAFAMFVAPQAPIFTYQGSADSHTWDAQLFGSLPGYASFLLYNAKP